MGEAFKARAAAALTATVILASLLASPGAGASAAAPQSAEKASRQTTINVGSFNIRSVQNDKKRAGNEAPWRKRRGAVIRDILKQGVDVVGLQEASQNAGYRKHLVAGKNQYLDLRNGLNRAGGSFQLTNTNPTTSRTTRILYDTRVVSLVRSGTYKYKHQSGGKNDGRFLVWAIFQRKGSGKRFFFANTHLGVKSASLQRAQWRELIKRVNALKSGLPVVVVGDFQRSKLKNPAAEMMRAMKAAGYGDVVGQQPNEANLYNPRPDRLKHAWVNSMNGFSRNVASFSYEDKRRKAGNNPDWIFASNHLKVKKWRVVVHMNPRTLRLRGVIPSDHNLVRATLVL
jgi:endonuclease/exonuclease/phosphatase family metal-dependent hydrolase